MIVLLAFMSPVFALLCFCFWYESRDLKRKLDDKTREAHLYAASGDFAREALGWISSDEDA